MFASNWWVDGALSNSDGRDQARESEHLFDSFPSSSSLLCFILSLFSLLFSLFDARLLHPPLRNNSETSLTIESLDSDSFRPLRPLRHILSAPCVTPRVFSTLPQEQISMEWLYAKFGEWVKHLPGEEQRRLFGGTAEDFYRI